jgi:peptidoglycan/LPS O-acetylase OafA/YrhL
MDETLSNSNIDGLRALAIVGVVCIHAMSPLINAAAGQPFHDGLFWSLVALNQAMRFPVPAFFFPAGL